MAQLLVPNKQIVEEKLRQQKIKEVEENRKELEKKLDFLNLEMSLISTNSTNSPPNKKKNAKLPSRDRALKESISKITKEWQLLQERRAERMNQKIEKTRKQEEIMKIEEKNEQERTKQEKLQRLAAKIDQIQERMKEREAQRPKEKEEIKALLHTPKIVKRMQEARENDEKTEKERIQEKLAEIKEKYKSMSKQEIESHAKIHDELIQKIKQEKEKEKINGLKEVFKPSYKSPLHEIIEFQEKTQKSQKSAEELQKRQETLQKLKEFQQKVKKNFLPSIDPEKKRNMEENIFKLKHPAFKFFVPKDVKDKALTEEDIESYNTNERNTQTIGKSYLAYAKTHKMAHPNARSLEKITDNHELENNSSKTPGQTSLKTSKYENYLRKIPMPKKKDEGISTIMQNQELSQNEKKQQVFMRAEAWEDEAERKEQLMKVKGVFGNEADDLRVKSMKAKLAFLRNGSLE